jgi:hypothetical protein
MSAGHVREEGGFCLVLSFTVENTLIFCDCVHDFNSFVLQIVLPSAVERYDTDFNTENWEDFK